MAEQISPPRTGRGLKWVLGVSLSLNLLIIGALAGAAYRHSKDPDMQRGRSFVAGNYGGPLARSLPKDARRALIRDLRSEVSGVPSRPERQATYREMISALRQEPFDPERVTLVFARQSDVARQVQVYAQDAWLKIVTDMSAEERADVAYRLEEALRRPLKKGPKNGKN